MGNGRGFNFSDSMAMVAAGEELERVSGGRVSKTVPEPGACVSATGEVRRCGHGVADTVFAFRPPDRPRELAGLPAALSLKR